MFFGDNRKKKLTKRQFEDELKTLIEFVESSVSPFEHDSKDKQEARVRRARADQDFFNQTYLPHYFTDESPDFHREMEELEAEGERQQRPVAIAAPRGFSKSTRITFAKRLKRALFKEKRFIILVGADETTATGFTVSIRTELEHNSRISHDFDAQKTQQWAAGEFVTKGGVEVMARGKGQRIRGLKFGAYRPDDICIDDPEDDEEVRNPERIKVLLKWVREAVLPSLDPKRGLVSWVGTLLAKKSALAQIMEEPEWLVKVYRAIENPEWKEEAVLDPVRGLWVGQFVSGTPLWPERFDLKTLSRIRRRIGSVAFNKELQNTPEDDDGMFKRDWFRRIRYNTLPNVALYPYGARDPSLKHGQHNDFKAHVTVARGEGFIYVLYASIKRISRDAMIEEDYSLVSRFNLLQLGVELDGWQELLRADYDRKALAKGWHLPIVPVPHNGASKDSEARIGGLSSPIQGGIIIFCEGPASEVGDMETLIDQTVVFPSSVVNDDGPDALQMAYGLAERRGSCRPYYEQVGHREAHFGTGAW